MLYYNFAHSHLDLLARWIGTGFRHFDRPPRILGFGVYRSRLRVPARAAMADGAGKAMVVAEQLIRILSSSFEYIETIPTHLDLAKPGFDDNGKIK